MSDKTIQLVIGVGLILLLLIGAFIGRPEFTIQYMNSDGTTSTEIYRSTNEFNDRMSELKADTTIKIYTTIP